MRVFVIAVFLVAFANSTVYAYLGGFERTDGYVDVGPFDFSIGDDYDVSKYNAGQFPAVLTASSYVSYPSGTGGLWTKTMGPLMPPGALPGFPRPPQRPHVYATSHRYGPLASPPVKPIQGDRALVITTNNQGWRDPTDSTKNGPAQGYEYTMDRFDLQGIDPTKTGKSVIELSWFSCASLPGPDDTGLYQGVPGLVPGTIGHTVSFFDGVGSLPGVEIGYVQPGTSQDFAAFRVGGAFGGNWTNTKIAVSPSGWHRWDLKLDLVNDRVSIDYTPVLTFDENPGRNVVLGTPVNLVSSEKLLTPMNSLEKLEFKSSAGINNSKVWVLDDFEFCVTEAPLSALLDGGTLWSGDKQFSDFSYRGIGDMPAAEDVFVKAITDADGNFGIRFQGAFVDAADGGASDALIEYKVTAPEGKLIKDVHMSANPLVIGGGDKAGLVSITETFLPDNDQTVLSVFDIEPGSRKLTDWADLIDADGNLAPVQELHVQKDIIAWARQLGSVATLSFIDQSFSQCNADPMNPGICFVDDGTMNDDGPPIPLAVVLAGDFNGDGVVDAADYAAWRDGLGTTYTQADYEAWKANFGITSAGIGSLSSAAVPEPSSLVLVGLASVGAISLARRRAKDTRRGRCSPQGTDDPSA